MKSYIASIFENQQSYFNENNTLSYDFRIKQLNVLRNSLRQYKSQIIAALYQDLRRPEFEAYFEIELIKEVDYAIKSLKKWMQTKRFLPSLTQFPAVYYQEAQAVGNVLIISPWNYPFELTFRPLIGAIAAGNCVIIKPSELATASSQLIAKIIRQNFVPEYITVIEGGVEETSQLLQLHFNHIFFTGSTQVGKIVAMAAAKNLIPTTLELGGKSPAIVCSDANLALTARRLMWGKFINAGQTCIAPDYVLVHESVYGQLISEMKKVICEFYPDGAKASNDFGRIINERHWQRLVNLINQSDVIYGGGFDIKDKYIEPTLIEVGAENTAIMQEEIFGPLLPICKFTNLTNVLAELKQLERPLALYLFTQDKLIQSQVQHEVISGGMAINDCVIHIASHKLPFGGIGYSGMGGYHGKHTFDLFTHYKTVLKRFNFEIPWRFPPYNRLKLKLIKSVAK